MATFHTPEVPVNPTSWGPPPTSTTSRFSSLPYAPFGRSDRIGRCADFTTLSFQRTGDASTGFRNQYSSKKNVNVEFQYKIDSEEAKEFQLVDSSKLASSGRGGARFVPQAKRRQNAQRLKQLNARRKGEDNYQLSQHGRTRNAGRGGGMQGRGGRGGRGQWRDRIDRQASGEFVVVFVFGEYLLEVVC
jgi:translation initiation factor 3 subunit D